MSGLFKSIGKIFKKVVPFLKKIALPALAIAAVVVTGGAALGLLPGIAGLGGLAASLGASPLVAGILSAAGTGATIGAITGFVTTGKLSGAIHGATTGLLTGAAAGGISAAIGGVTGTAAGAGKSLFPIANGVDPLAPLPAATGVTGAVGAGGAAAAGIGQAASGIGSAVAQAAPTAVASAGSGAGGVLGFLGKNPLVLSGVMKGIGGALQSKAQLDQTKAVRDSYNVSRVFQPYDSSSTNGLQSPDQRFNQVIYGNGQYEYDPNSGRILPKAGG
jgi:hypothetical protein